MLFIKISISIIIIISVFIFSTNNNEKELKPATVLHHSNIDSLISKIKSNGWNEEFISESRSQIINANNNEVSELKKTFSAIPATIQKSFINSLFLKKEEMFEAMYDTLVSIIDSKPRFFFYYEELVFAARATNQLALLESLVNDKIKGSKRQYNFLLGLTASAQGKYDDAVKYFENGLNKYPKNNFLLYNLYYAYRNLDDYKKAMDILNLLSDNISKDDLFYIPMLLAKGSLNFLAGEYKKAETFYNSALKISIAENDNQNEANARINLGLIEDVNGDVFSARKAFGKGLEIAKNINDVDLIAYAQSELGVSYSYTNELIESKENYLSSYNLYKKIGDILRLSLLSSNIAKIYQTMFDYKSAIKYYEQGIEFAGENKRAHALNLRGLADVYTNISDYSKALNYYKEASKISSKIKDLSLQSGINSGPRNVEL